MIIILRGIIIFLLLLSLCSADSNSAIEDEPNYIDKIHKTFSEAIVKWSGAVDTILSGWLDNNETNTSSTEETNASSAEEAIAGSIEETNISTIEETNITSINETNISSIEEMNASSVEETNLTAVAANASMNTATVVFEAPVNTAIVATDTPPKTLESRAKSVDAFFQNKKYFNETENTFIRVRVVSYFQSKESSDFDLALSAQMPFKKSRENLKVFVENITLDNAEDILKDDSGDDHEAPDIGLHYYKPVKGIKSRYSIGLGGIDPFVKARYNMPIRTNQWLIDMVQLFKYSTDDKFEEETNIYFDKKVGEKSLFRIQIHRKTQENIAGMDYALSLQYYRSLKKETGFGFGQLFFANTKYPYAVDNGIEPPQIKHYAGIHNYVTSFSWRENIWRKWFYYEVRPSVSFHKQYDYEPNYRIRLFFDFYFGKFN